MGITITRAGDEGQNFTQTSEGMAFNNLTVSTNAKGHAQIEMKLCYTSPDDLEQCAPAQVARILANVRASLEAIGIPMAGK